MTEESCFDGSSGRCFSVIQNVQTRTAIHPALYSSGTRDSIPGREADHFVPRLKFRGAIPPFLVCLHDLRLYIIIVFYLPYSLHYIQPIPSKFVYIHRHVSHCIVHSVMFQPRQFYMYSCIHEPACRVRTIQIYYKTLANAGIWFIETPRLAREAVLNLG
jgi:hypothetical protein